MNTAHLPIEPQQKLQLGYKTNYHPESSENQAVWKSDSQGIKEPTFIQTGRRGGDAGTRKSRTSSQPHTHVCRVKIGGYTSGVRDPNSIPAHPA